jgi:hypothetical protein
MKLRYGAVAIAISVGLIILIGTFVPVLASVKLELVHWAVILAGVAVLVGIGNLFSVHYQKLRRREKGWGYSLTLLFAMLATLLVGVMVGPSGAWMQAVVETIIPRGSLVDGAVGGDACLRQRPPPAPPCRLDVGAVSGDRRAHAPGLGLPAFDW